MVPCVTFVAGHGQSAMAQASGNNLGQMLGPFIEGDVGTGGAQGSGLAKEALWDFGIGRIIEGLIDQRAAGMGLADTHLNRGRGGFAGARLDGVNHLALGGRGLVLIAAGIGGKGFCNHLAITSDLKSLVLATGVPTEHDAVETTVAIQS